MIPNLLRFETRPARHSTALLGSLALLASPLMQAQSDPASSRERISINDDWTFFKYASADEADDLIYDVRPEIVDSHEGRPADAKPTEAIDVAATQRVLKPWILPSGNAFIFDPAKRHVRPEGDPGSDFPFVQSGFDDSKWERVKLPHDWAIKGPFYTGA
ncbi:MAG TPA: hypothetical protein VMM36_14960, partial [Opitutaceae bacterium]|nr:hypothetical protein [Opitutaceae bacterium]